MPRTPRTSRCMKRNVSLVCLFAAWFPPTRGVPCVLIIDTSQPWGGSLGHDGSWPLQCRFQIRWWWWHNSPAIWMVVWYCEGLVDSIGACFQPCEFVLYLFWIISWAAVLRFLRASHIYTYVERISFSKPCLKFDGSEYGVLHCWTATSAAG